MSEMQMTLEREQAPKEVEQIVLCDLDRAMIKSDNLVDVVRDFLVERENVNPEQQARLDTFVDTVHSNVGSAVQPYETMRQEFGLERDPEKLADATIAFFGEDELKKRILIPGADVLFTAFEVKNIEHAILTSADDVTGQQFKIALFERLVGQENIPYWIINHETKASTAEDHWFDADTGMFVIPAPDNVENGGWKAKQVCLLDDKVKNLRTSEVRDNIIPIHVYADNVHADDAVSLREVADVVANDGELMDLRWQPSLAA